MTKSYFGVELEAVMIARPSRHFPGHEERIAAHSNRVLAELERMGAFCLATGRYTRRPWIDEENEDER